jgi:hypothetical protein
MDVIRGIPFLGQNYPMQGDFYSQEMSARGNPSFSYRIQMGGGFTPYNQGHQGFTQNLGTLAISS